MRFRDRPFRQTPAYLLPDACRRPVHGPPASIRGNIAVGLSPPAWPAAACKRETDPSTLARNRPPTRLASGPTRRVRQTAVPVVPRAAATGVLRSVSPQPVRQPRASRLRTQTPFAG